MVKNHVTKTIQPAPVPRQAQRGPARHRAARASSLSGGLSVDKLATLLGLPGRIAAHERLTECGFQIRLYDRDGNAQYCPTEAAEKHLAVASGNAASRADGIRCCTGPEPETSWRATIVPLLEASHADRHAHSFPPRRERIL
ncbi:hypothetical protein N5W20_06715 [Candidatus Kirkpatrickella diaphorinae]|uniref:Uncharacterized protein n=1 Tax=Candidatus Kirkpatrickella diaphorinae TaxID=2984322 RepID=A0ABY6GH21_9PROT|nr:hypothetical protein [Candidatus Kirkpatrickella diaphorinae]UYH50797.1 hypothetical protein N5W20_06715 [Candidatus Kirkpatrickella diaphorinae]